MNSIQEWKKISAEANALIHEKGYGDLTGKITDDNIQEVRDAIPVIYGYRQALRAMSDLGFDESGIIRDSKAACAAVCLYRDFNRAIYDVMDYEDVRATKRRYPMLPPHLREAPRAEQCAWTAKNVPQSHLTLSEGEERWISKTTDDPVERQKEGARLIAKKNQMVRAEVAAARFRDRRAPLRDDFVRAFIEDKPRLLPGVWEHFCQQIGKGRPKGKNHPDIDKWLLGIRPIIGFEGWDREEVRQAAKSKFPDTGYPLLDSNELTKYVANYLNPYLPPHDQLWLRKRQKRQEQLRLRRLAQDIDPVPEYLKHLGY
jgi:hypothetical protein